MKKFVAIGISLVLLSSGVASLSATEASRLKYHYYFLDHQVMKTKSAEKNSQKVLRNSTERIRPFNVGLNRRREIVDPGEKTDSFSRFQNTRYSQTNKRDVYGSTNVEQLLRARNTNGLRWKKEVKRVPATQKNIGGDVRDMMTYENDHFSIQVPLSWIPIRGDVHLFKSKRVKDFVISVEKIADDCDSISFTMCAITLSKMKNSNLDYFITSKIKRKSSKDFTILNSEVMTSTFMESFLATSKGRDETFINRFFVQDLDGSVFLIETKSPSERALDFISTSKQIFYSFRFFQD